MSDPYVTICGGNRLEGNISVQGAKNTALPIMAACLLTRGRTVLYDCPRIRDVYMMASVMEQIGCQIVWQESALLIDTTGVIDSCIPKGKAGMFRGSSLLMGALLARDGKVLMEEPGGCRIGKRPLDYHFLGFRKMGISVEENEFGYACFCDRIEGAEIRLPYPSVGATENLMLAAAGTEEITLIRGCAREPEICDLSAFLIHMGVSIEGAGTSVLKIRGKKELRASHYRIPYDRIAAATYLIAGMMTKGDISLRVRGSLFRMDNILKLLERMGASIYRGENMIRIKTERLISGVKVSTSPYPGIPTDIQPLLVSALLCACQPSVIYENVFEARFQVCTELEKMGGRIRISGNCARIDPVKKLHGASVNAVDLRGGAALVLAGLVAEGTTQVHSFSCVERGYEDFTGHLNGLGARIKKEST